MHMFVDERMTAREIYLEVTKKLKEWCYGKGAEIFHEVRNVGSSPLHSKNDL